MLKRIRNKFRKIKWWVQRANGKVTPDMWWDYKYTLADFIKQGLEGLLNDGIVDWDAPQHKQEKKDLEFILEWAETFPCMESGLVALDQEDYKQLCERFEDTDVMIISPNAWKEWEKTQQKAFKLLGKNIHTLWD